MLESSHTPFKDTRRRPDNPYQGSHVALVSVGGDGVDNAQSGLRRSFPGDLANTKARLACYPPAAFKP